MIRFLLLSRARPEPGERTVSSADGLRRVQSHLRGLPSRPGSGHRLGHGPPKRQPRRLVRAALRFPRPQRRLQPRGGRPLIRLFSRRGRAGRLHRAKGLICTASATTSSLTRPPTPCSTVSARRSCRPPTSTSPPFTKGSPTWSRSFCTSPMRTWSSRRSAIGGEPSPAVSILTDLAREFGYARSRSRRATALRSGVDTDGLAAFDSDVPPSNEAGRCATIPKPEAPRAGLSVGLGGVRGIHDGRAAEDRCAFSTSPAWTRPTSARPRSATRWSRRSPRRPAMWPASS